MVMMMMMMLIIKNKVYGNVDIKDRGTDVCFSENFLDIDECSTKSHSCHVNATCSNMQGSYKCACIAGYSGDGKKCTGKRLTLSTSFIKNNGKYQSQFFMCFTLNGKSNWRMVSKKERQNVFKFQQVETSKTFKPSRRTSHCTESQLPKMLQYFFCYHFLFIRMRGSRYLYKVRHVSCARLFLHMRLNYNL